nr:hypothetical protein CFP56_02516 [Quercus suber]
MVVVVMKSGSHIPGLLFTIWRRVPENRSVAAKPTLCLQYRVARKHDDYSGMLGATWVQRYWILRQRCTITTWSPRYWCEVQPATAALHHDIVDFDLQLRGVDDDEVDLVIMTLMSDPRSCSQSSDIVQLLVRDEVAGQLHFSHARRGISYIGLARDVLGQCLPIQKPLVQSGRLASSTKAVDPGAKHTSPSRYTRFIPGLKSLQLFVESVHCGPGILVLHRCCGTDSVGVNIRKYLLRALVRSRDRCNVRTKRHSQRQAALHNQFRAAITIWTPELQPNASQCPVRPEDNSYTVVARTDHYTLRFRSQARGRGRVLTQQRQADSPILRK